METHHCVILERYTKKTLTDYVEIKALDWYCARHIMAQMVRDGKFNDKFNQNEFDWAVDSIQSFYNLTHHANSLYLYS